ncbi:hypothetical protein JCM3765_000903 [Sporobolomyces pararoseus]
MIPSRDLPQLTALDLPSIWSNLTTIRNQYLAPVTIDLRQPLEVKDGEMERSVKGCKSVGEEQEDQREEERDNYETKFLRGWLERLVQSGLKQLARGTEDEANTWEPIIDEASKMISRMDDDSEETLYLLPSPSSVPASTPSPPPVNIRNHTLVSSTTGHRTWGSAPILARRLALEPTQFFPNPPTSSSPLRILELGSGTGLVGLSSVSILSALGFSNTTIVLSDGGEASVDSISTGGVLDNLRRNLENHIQSCQTFPTGVQAEVEVLRWGDYLQDRNDVGGESRSKEKSKSSQDLRYDVILGADLIYEAQQAESLWAAVAGNLRFPQPTPSASTDSSLHSPSFHLVIPLRPTHTTESTAADEYFPAPTSNASNTTSTRVLRDDKGQCWRLVAKEREEFAGPDGFGRRGMGEKVIRYRYYRIEWENCIVKA